MKRLSTMAGPALVLVLACTAKIAAASTPPVTAAEYSRTVARVCAGAVLFAGRHEIGTRAGAIAVSRDIRRTGTRRLHLVAALPEPEPQVPAIRQWLGVEQLLVDAFARDYLRIWDEIENASTSAQQAALPVRLHALVHETDGLKRRADAYELRLGVPDCTGGGHY
jgi:hypothetical protein